MKVNGSGAVPPPGGAVVGAGVLSGVVTGVGAGVAVDVGSGVGVAAGVPVGTGVGLHHFAANTCRNQAVLVAGPLRS